MGTPHRAARAGRVFVPALALALAFASSQSACLVRAAPSDAGADVPRPTCPFQTLEPYTGSLACPLPAPPSDAVITSETPPPAAPACAFHRYDALIVLGSPSNPDGTPSDTNLSRVAQAIQANCMGLGDTFIVTGGAVHNQFVEAYVLRDALLARGVPADRIYLEPQARHTDENVYYSTQIMLAHGWKSALVVSELSHLRFAAECDTNCCVDLGYGEILDFGGTPALQLMQYVLTPDATLASESYCHLLAQRYQCVNLNQRDSCAGMIMLPDASTGD